MSEETRTDLKGVDVSVLRHRLIYDGDNGTFTHQNSPYPSYNGKQAGSINSHGYLVIKVGGKYLLAHQIAWLMTYGTAPGMPIDHKDGDRANNQIENLRLATASQNGGNRRVGANAPLGRKGITRSPNGNYRVRIKVDNRKLRVGTFKTIEEAAAAYNAAAFHHFGDYARLNDI